MNMWNDDGDVRIWPFHQACSFIMSIKEERWWETKDEMMMLKKVDKRGQFSCKFQTLILFYSVVTFIFFRFFFFHTLMNVGVKSTKFEEGRRRRIFSFMFLLYEREWGMKRKSKKKEQKHERRNLVEIIETEENRTKLIGWQFLFEILFKRLKSFKRKQTKHSMRWSLKLKSTKLKNILNFFLDFCVVVENE